MPHDPDQLRREDCRWAILTALSRRPTSAFDAMSIRSVLLKGHDFTQHEVDAALTFLTGNNHVLAVHDAMGATKSFQITPAGTLAHERR